MLGHHLYKELAKARTVGGKSALIRNFRKVIDRGQAQCGDAVHYEMLMSEEEWWNLRQLIELTNKVCVKQQAHAQSA